MGVGVSYPSLRTARSKGSIKPRSSKRADALRGSAAWFCIRGLATLLRFVDTKRTAVEDGAVQLVDRLAGAGCVGHRDEPEAARAAALPIHRDGDLDDAAALAEQITEAVLRGAVGQIPNVQTIAHDLSLFRT